MSERPALLLAALLGTAFLLAALTAARLLAIGPAGLLGLTTTAVGVFSACIYFLGALTRGPLVLLVFVVLGLLSVAGFASAVRAYARERRLLRVLPLAPLGGELERLAQAAGLRAIYRTPAQRPAAFCYGLSAPRVVVSDGLLERLSAEERAAAIWHEAYHARGREPLKCLVARFCARTFFWLPVLTDLLERYVLVRELEADRLATARTSRRALAGALYEVLGEATPTGAIGLGDQAGARIDRLFDSGAPLPRLSSPARMTTSVGAAGLYALALVIPAPAQIGAPDELRSMLTTMSLHGLPGMASGLFVNGLILGYAVTGLRRRLSYRSVRQRG